MPVLWCLRSIGDYDVAATGNSDSSKQHTNISGLAWVESNLVIHARIQFYCHVVDILGPHADVPLVLRSGVL